MDKYEYRVKTEQMLEHMERKRYKKAMEIADTIDWRRVKNPAMLNSVSEIYEFNGEYQKSRDVLFVAYDRAPNSRKTIYRLGTLALRLNDVDEASDCYEEFVKLAPKDPNQYILKYKILKARRAPLSEQIDALEEFKKAEYIEKWAYELACLYDQTGMTAECLEECDDLILWFSEGKYVYKAMELKMKYKPLTPLQQEKYNSQKKAYEHPVVESEEAEEQQEEEAKTVEEAPENAVAESPEKDTDKGEDKEAETSILREEPKEVSTEDIVAKALAAVAETEEVPLTAEKKEAEASEEPAEKPHKRSGLRQSVKGATLAEALKKGMAVANGENPESKALNKSDEDLRVTGQMKIDDILQAWEAKQKDNAEAIEIQKKKDEEILAQKKLEAEKRREEEARRIEEQQRAAEEARRIAEQKAAEEARRAAARRAEEERLLAEQRAEEERRRAIEEAEAEERRLEQEAAEKAKAEAEARRKQEEEETQEIEEALEEVEAEEDEFEEAELEEGEADEDEFEEDDFEEAELEEVEADEDEFEEAEYEEVPDKTDDLADLLRELEETDAEKENDDQGFFDDEFEEDDVNDDFLDDDLDAEYDEYEEEPKGEEAYDDDEFEEGEFEEGDFEDEFEEEEPEPDLSNIDDLTIEEPSEEEIQRRIKKGRGGVPFDTGFVVTGRYDLSATSEIGLRAGLTEEQKQLFSYFVPVRGMSEQIVEVLDNDRRERREGTSRTGNIVVIGHKGSGKTVLAIQKQRNLKQGKVAIVTGESLNKKELGGIVQKLRGGAIIIEKAGQLNTRTVRDLNRLMEKRTGELLVVLEDQRKPLEKLFTANPSFKKKFTSKLELPVFINDELVTFGQTYAKENGYKLDEMGILALYSRIDVMQREDHAVTVAEVKEIMDDAIDHSQKANVKHFARRVFGKGTDDRDRIILKEDDFRI